MIGWSLESDYLRFYFWCCCCPIVAVVSGRSYFITCRKLLARACEVFFCMRSILPEFVETCALGFFWVGVEKLLKGLTTIPLFVLKVIGD